MNRLSTSATLRALGTGADPRNTLKFIQQFSRTLRPDTEPYEQQPGREALVIAPGLSCSERTYAEAAHYFSRTVNVLERPDYLRGFGALLNRTSIQQEAEKLLEFCEQSDTEKVNLLGHSKGGVVVALARILDKERNVLRDRLGKVLTVSAPLNGSNLAYAVGLSHWFDSVKDFDPEDEVIRRIQEQGRIDYNAVSEKDELLSQKEMLLASELVGQQEFFQHGHFALINNPVENANNLLTRVNGVLAA